MVIGEKESGLAGKIRGGRAATPYRVKENGYWRLKVLTTKTAICPRVAGSAGQ